MALPGRPGVGPGRCTSIVPFPWSARIADQAHPAGPRVREGNQGGQISTGPKAVRIQLATTGGHVWTRLGRAQPPSRHGRAARNDAAAAPHRTASPAIPRLQRRRPHGGPLARGFRLLGNSMPYVTRTAAAGRLPLSRFGGEPEQDVARLEPRVTSGSWSESPILSSASSLLGWLQRTRHTHEIRKRDLSISLNDNPGSFQNERNRAISLA
jgi:hypothetical protein